LRDELRNGSTGHKELSGAQCLFGLANNDTDHGLYTCSNTLFLASWFGSQHNSECVSDFALVFFDGDESFFKKDLTNEPT